MASSSPALVVAFTGGIASSFLVARAARAGRRVVAVTVDTGQLQDGQRDALALRAKALGADRHLVADARQEVWDRWAAWLIKGNVLEGATAPLGPIAERYAIADALAGAARAEAPAASAGYGGAPHGAPVSHGATGDDAALLDLALLGGAPELQALAPLRDDGLSRGDARAWLSEHGLLGAGVDRPEAPGLYAVERSPWGSTARGGDLAEGAWDPPQDEAWPGVVAPWDAAELPEELDLDLERGLPTSACGQPADGPAVVRLLGRMGARHGVGRGVRLGEGPLGEPARTAFEAPALLILIAAHRELEKVVLTRRQRLAKDALALTYGDLFARGLWHEPLLRDLEALFESTQRLVTGRARVRLYRGAVEVVGVESPHALARAASPRPARELGRDAAGFARVQAAAAAAARRRDVGSDGARGARREEEE